MKAVKEKLPINLDVLKWARTSLNLTLEDVAHRMGRSFRTEIIQEWENGFASPTYPQLERLAFEIYKRPVAVFFFPNIPKEDTPKTEFRTLPDTITDSLPPEIIKAYRQAKTLQLNLEELHEELKPVNPNLIDQYRISDQSNLLDLAEQIRRTLGITIEVQRSWKSSEVAFKEWRNALEEKGIFVFKDAFRNDDYSGFCAYDEKYPLIFVNNSMPDTRQIFTLFHELGHLLYRSGGIDFRVRSIPESFGQRYANYEKNCNQFASEVLVPSIVFNTLNLNVSEKRFEELADYFSVSREVILRKYFDRRLVDRPYYQAIIDKWSKQKAKERPPGGNSYLTKKAYLGDRYVHLAFTKYYQNKISIENLSSFLNVKIKHISNFEHYAIGMGV